MDHTPAPRAKASWQERVKVGTSSWSDRSLTQDSNWYPRRTMKAAERMAFYASRFSVVEIETTYRFPPTPAIAQQWAERTPDGFTFDLPAWSLLTGQATRRESLWEDLHREIKDERQDNVRLYDTHLSEHAMDECWARFRHALDPLRNTNKLGRVILRYPRWFKPREKTRAAVGDVRARMDGYPLAIEFACNEWVDTSNRDHTFDFLEDLDIAFVCADAGDDDPRGRFGVGATTSTTGIVRLLGRRTRSNNDESWTPDWRGYQYSDDELAAMLPRLEHLADSCDELHVLVGTCWLDHAVRNGERLLDHLGAVDLREATTTLPLE